MSPSSVSRRRTHDVQQTYKPLKFGQTHMSESNRLIESADVSRGVSGASNNENLILAGTAASVHPRDANSVYETQTVYTVNERRTCY